MKNRASPILIASFTFLLLVGCMKEDNKESGVIAGMYVGETNQVVEWANSMEGHNKRDTLYRDTFWVTLAGPDSIIFSNKGFEWLFMIDTSYNYVEYYGSHSYRMFEFKGNDSLTVDYWTYGGPGPNFNKETRDFIGLKQ